MRSTFILLGLTLGLVPTTSHGADGGAYAVLTAVPSPPRAGCRVARGPGGELRAPLYAPETDACPVARVADEEISLGELAGALAASHTSKDSKARRGAKAAGMDFAPTLDRLVEVRLLVLEAREMGLPELADYRAAMEAFRASTLRTILQEEAAAKVKPDPAEVERFYRAAVKQWKIRSVRFDKEEDAKAFRAAVGKGGSFDGLARGAVAEKKAQGGEPGFVTGQAMLPELAKAADALAQGQVSQPVKVATGWVVLKLEGVRYPEDAKARAQARAQSLGEQQHKAVRRFHESLVKKYATVDERLLASLDFEAGGEAGFQALAKDPRELVKIRGEKPITVAELTDQVSKKFFHGIADPIKEHRVNAQKADAFDRLVGERLFAREARERRLEQGSAFRRRVDAYDRVLAFNTLLERVVLPEVKVTEGDVQALYEQRKGQLTSPPMYRLDGIGFRTAKGAQAALEKLKGGTDPEWLRANAEGRLDPKEEKLQLQGALLSVNALPASLVKALAGAQPGELRLYSSDDGAEHWVVRVQGVVPPSVQPYADAREKLAREVEAAKVAAGIRDYAAKLRKVQKVDLLITRIGS